MADRYPPPPMRHGGRGGRRGNNGDSRRDRCDDYDRYHPYARDERPAYDDQRGFRPRDERYRPSPPPRSPPRRPRGEYDLGDREFSFRGAAERDAYRPPQGDFSFRASGPQFPPPDQYPQPPPRAPRQERRGDRAGRGDNRRGAYRGRGPIRPSNREILHETGRASTPEQLEGMNVDGQVRFNTLASSSEGSDDDDAARPHSSSEEEGEIRRKRFKVDAPPAPKPDVPKWSNPDPYSALPPVEATAAPKKDIVQVIRKAKNDTAPRHDNMSHAVAQNADFISFTFDDDMNEDKASTGTRNMDEDGLSDAPSVGASTTTGRAPLNGTNTSNGSGVPSFKVKRDTRSDVARGFAPPPPQLSDGELSLPPRPPPSLVMPSDEELMQQYIGQPKGKKRKHEEQSTDKGEITEAWRANWTDATPWCTNDHADIANVDMRLHEEIQDFFDFVRPHEHEDIIRQDLIQRVQYAVRGSGGDAKNVDIKCFGSFAAGLYLPTADMDLVAVSRSFLSYGQRSYCQTPSKMHKLMAHLIKVGIAQAGNNSVVGRAKVPIIKFTDIKTGIKVDISFENDSGLLANETFQEWKMQYPQMPVIVVLIKQMLAMRDLNEVFTGGVGGFSIICLVVNMLELMPEDQWIRLNSAQNYGELLLHFLDLFGNQFNLRTTGIKMDPPSYFDKIKEPHRAQNDTGLTIIDPNNPNNDISGGSREVHTVFEVFRKAHSQILRRMEKIRAGKDVRGSILECVLGGNYSAFIRQRDRLYKVHNGERVSPPPEPAGNAQPRPQKRGRPKPSKTEDPPNKRPKGERARDLPGVSAGMPLAAWAQSGPPNNKGASSGTQASTQEKKQKPKKTQKPKQQPQQAVQDQQGRPNRTAESSATRAAKLKQQYPALASQIGEKMGRGKTKKFKAKHNLS